MMGFARSEEFRKQKRADKKDAAFMQRAAKMSVDVTGKVGGVRVSRPRVGGANQSAAEYFNLGSLDPSVDVLVSIVNIMPVLDQLYMSTGDQRFDSARRALTRGLDQGVHKDFDILNRGKAGTAGGNETLERALSTLEIEHGIEVSQYNVGGHRHWQD